MHYLGRPVFDVVFFIVLVSLVFCAEEGLLQEGEYRSQEWRAKTLLRVDQLLGEKVPFSARTFFCNQEVVVHQEDQAYLQDFSCRYGYFSPDHPLVGFVTEDVFDVQIVEGLFYSLLSNQNSSFVQMAVGELLSKVLAYRNLQRGMTVQIPVMKLGRVVLVEYRVDHVLDLWQGIPAFCLIPCNFDVNPILLFRGTDFSLLSKQSWASILSDLDVSGVGFSLFQKARSQIHDWLIKANALCDQKTKVFGFSLGGILALYTAIFEKDLICYEESMAFNAPGLPESMLEPSMQDFTQYVTEGDPVSKLGRIFPKVYMLSSAKTPNPIQAHTQLMIGEPFFSCFEVCVGQENACRIMP